MSQTCVKPRSRQPSSSASGTVARSSLRPARSDSACSHWRAFTSKSSGWVWVSAKEVSSDGIERGRAAEGEGEVELGAQDLEDGADAGLSRDREPPEDGAADEDGPGAAGDRL